MQPRAAGAGLFLSPAEPLLCKRGGKRRAEQAGERAALEKRSFEIEISRRRRIRPGGQHRQNRKEQQAAREREATGKDPVRRAAHMRKGGKGKTHGFIISALSIPYRAAGR